MICGLTLDGKTIGMCTSVNFSVGDTALDDANSGQISAKCKS